MDCFLRCICHDKARFQQLNDEIKHTNISLSPTFEAEYIIDKPEESIDFKLKVLDRLYIELLKRWQTSDNTRFRNYLHSVLREGLGQYCAKTPRGKAHVENAVIMGLGPFESRTPESALLQLIFFLDIVEFLEENGHSKGKIRMYAQDPLFDELEVIFLCKFGIEVYECPQANDFITPDTFLYTPYITWKPLLCSILPGKDPLLYIGHDMNILVRLSGEQPVLKPDELFMEEKLIGKEGAEIASTPLATQEVAKRFKSNREGRHLQQDAPKDHARAPEWGDLVYLIGLQGLMDQWIYFRSGKAILQREEKPEGCVVM
ncbi:hypothetical protein NA57DRAFT_62453 [Rhizodiscina lignyota]|uniref:SRR1-like domain-containing protein n=1 Tax=Rhizodiscina lignyota TaxID=1504668 RepID=A0A9P4I609_9PEZI|nr:hypothetical protein NA57DRAFT_62453 [Rhizodiscina lignyota]